MKIDIPYEEIDELMIPIIKILNENGYYTKFCCQGHEDRDPAYIMFDDNIEDNQMIELLKIFDNHYLKYVEKTDIIQKGVQFKLWKYVRYSKDELKSNWMWDMTGTIWEKHRRKILSKVYQNLQKFFNNK